MKLKQGTRRALAGLGLLAALVSGVQAQQAAPVPLWKVQEGAKLGFVDQNGKMVIPPRFDAVSDFAGNVAVYESQQKPLRFGMIDRQGKPLEGLSFDEVFYFGSETDHFDRLWGHDLFPGNMSRFRVGEKWGFVDTSGKIAIPPRFDAVSEGFYEGLAGVEVGGQWGVIDTKGNFVIQPKDGLQFIKRFSEGIAPVARKTEGVKAMGWMDKNGNSNFNDQTMFTYEFSEGLAFASNGFAMVLVDRNFRRVGSLRFDDQITQFKGGVCLVAINKKAAIINKSGAIVTPVDCDAFKDFQDGAAAIAKGEKWGLVDAKGKMIAGFFYDYINPPFDGLRAAVRNQDRGYLDSAGHFMNGHYQRAYDFKDGLGRVVDKDGYFELVKPDGSVVWKSKSPVS